MNASRVIKMLLATAACVVQAACAGSFAAQTDDQSPLAPRVQALVDANRTYPQWSRFPATPTDAPRPEQFASRVQGLNASGQELERQATAIDWDLSDPAGFAAAVQARMAQVPVSPDAARTREDVEALAERLRRLATAPPPVPRN